MFDVLEYELKKKINLGNVPLKLKTSKYTKKCSINYWYFICNVMKYIYSILAINLLRKKRLANVK